MLRHNSQQSLRHLDSTGSQGNRPVISKTNGGASVVPFMVWTLYKAEKWMWHLRPVDVDSDTFTPAVVPADTAG